MKKRKVIVDALTLVALTAAFLVGIGALAKLYWVLFKFGWSVL